MTTCERDLFPDDVRRVKDEMDMHAVAGGFGWAAFKLADGTPIDHTAYESWNHTVKAAKWDRDNYMFLEIQPDGMTYKEAQAVLQFARFAHDQGYRIPSPDWDHYQAASMPRTNFDKKRAVKQLVAGKPIIDDNSVTYGNVPWFLRKVQE